MRARRLLRRLRLWHNVLRNDVRLYTAGAHAAGAHAADGVAALDFFAAAQGLVYVDLRAVTPDCPESSVSAHGTSISLVFPPAMNQKLGPSRLFASPPLITALMETL